LLGALLYFSLAPSAPYFLGAIGMLLPMALIAWLRTPGEAGTTATA
jgi:hypothetical protein